MLAASLTGIAYAAQLDGPASIVLDQYGVPTIVAETEHDAIYLQGYMHAKDRLFQMDFQRRLFAGRVSELTGSPGLAQDVQLRTLGLRRAAERSLAVQTPEVLAALQAYSDGVNAVITDTTLPLPVEYGALQLTRASIPLWTPTDSLTMAKGLAFGLSFDLTDIDRTVALVTYLNVCPLIGCNGLQLFNDDLYRTAPFEAGASIPPPPPPPEEPGSETPPEDSYPEYMSDPAFANMLSEYRSEIAEIPILRKALERNNETEGSNWFVAAGSRTDSGFPMLANDPHLSLGTPATFYEVHLYVTGGINATGVSFPGAPYLVQGCNDTICWGSTNNPIDVTDVYQEVLLAQNPNLPPGTPSHTLRNGVPEPLQLIPQVFMVNALDGGTPDTIVNANVPPTSGGLTFVVPRRNNGPIVRVVPPTATAPMTGISVQYTGWSATQEFETFRRFARAGTMQEFKDALQFFDFGSQNWVYADIQGNVAYYTSGEVPIREDLQNFPFVPDGLTPPYLIRDGTHTRRHEWLPKITNQPGQALSTEILPFAEMPQIENPAAGYILNANNDPIGTTFNNVSWDQFRAGGGRLYLASGYAEGYRNGRLQRLLDAQLAGGGTLTLPESKAIQGNNQLLDAEVLRPFLLQAYQNATAPGAPPELTSIVADPRIGEAINRLAAWDFSTPTGIQQGYDPGDNPLLLQAPSQAEIDSSVAATIYAMWRGQVVQRVINGTLNSLPSLGTTAPGSAQSMSALRRLLENYALNGGIGSSLINFFNVPGVADANVRRDMILLQSLLNGLNLLASDQFAPAFANSTNLGDYRWGKLHRIVFSHFLGGALNIPAAGSPLNLAPNLPGISRAGGMGALDASSHDARADGLNEFMFSSGPARRMIATMTPEGPQVLQVIPGGESGQPGNPHQVDQLFLWLVNAYKELPVSLADVLENADETLTYACGDGVRGPGEQCDDGNQNNADGCDTTCTRSPTITCLSPSAPGSADTCTASIACSDVATCADATGNPASATCDPSSGPYGYGSNNVTVSCAGVSTTCTATVTDIYPPTITVDPEPDELWPPNHHMVSVDAGVTATDACSAVTVALASATSDELDDGPGDGATVNDIQVGANVLTPSLRAERSSLGDGRVYTLVYSATDAAGNTAAATGTVSVPYAKDGLVDPMELRASQTEQGTLVSWNAIAGAVYYNVIRGNLSNLRDTGPSYDLGTATCIESESVSLDTYQYQDDEVPPPGEVFVYLAEYFDGLHHSTYGSPSAAKPHATGAGGCH
jgi:penicillin amidase